MLDIVKVYFKNEEENEKEDLFCPYYAYEKYFRDINSVTVNIYKDQECTQLYKKVPVDSIEEDIQPTVKEFVDGVIKCFGHDSKIKIKIVLHKYDRGDTLNQTIIGSTFLPIENVLDVLEDRRLLYTKINNSESYNFKIGYNVK